MTELREMFEEMAGSARPPGRAVADEVYAAGRRRYRRSRAAIAGGLVTLAVTVVATVSVSGLIPTNPAVNSAPPAGQETASATARPYPQERVQWTAAADSTHLFVGVQACPAPQCAKTTFQIIGSDDGGRTWTDRGAPINTATIGLVLGPRTLIATVLTGAGDASSSATLMMSTDGARTWSAVAAGPRIPDVPAGGRIVCGPITEPAHFCVPSVLDPASGRLSALANPPKLTVSSDWGQVIDTAVGGGAVWIAGTDPATGRPAVASSRDAGRTWSTHVFGGRDCGTDPCVAPELATLDGSTVYALLPADRSVYRGTVDGAWQQLDGAATALDGARPVSYSFVTNDGTHVLCAVHPGGDTSPGVTDVDTCQFWALRPGDTTYQKIDLAGLPTTVRPIERTRDGWFYAVDYVHGALYGSADGLHWSAVAGKR